MTKKIIAALVAAVLLGVIAGSIRYWSKTAPQREEASQIAKQAEADLDYIVHTKDIESYKAAEINERKVTNSKALVRIHQEKRLAIPAARRLAGIVGGVVFVLGLSYAVFTNKRAAAKRPAP